MTEEGASPDASSLFSPNEQGKEKDENISRMKQDQDPHCDTVELALRPPHYYGHFIMAWTKASSVIFLFLFKEPI